MTWKEFVEKVNEEIKKQGFDADIEILYIDTGNCPTRSSLGVYCSKTKNAFGTSEWDEMIIQ